MGYINYSRSENAKDAEERGMLPASRAAKLLGVKSTEISAYAANEWHHTGSKYRRTDYYDVKEIAMQLWGVGRRTQKTCNWLYLYPVLDGLTEIAESVLRGAVCPARLALQKNIARKNHEREIDRAIRRIGRAWERIGNMIVVAAVTPAIRENEEREKKIRELTREIKLNNEWNRDFRASINRFKRKYVDIVFSYHHIEEHPIFGLSI